MSWIFLIALTVFSYYMVQFLIVRISKKRLKVDKRLNDIKQSIGNQAEVMREESKKKGNVKFSFLRISSSMREQILLSGIKMNPERFTLTWILCICGPAFIAFTVSPNLIRSIVLIAVGAVAPPLYVKFAINKRRVLFERQLGDALMVISNGLRAGLSLQQALANVARTLPDPIGSEFMAIGRELQLGVGVEDTFSKVAMRMESNDMILLATAVSVQQQVGGNLAEILDTNSKVIRERLSIKRSIRTLTAQGKISGQIIGGLPVLLLVVVSGLNPDYMSVFYTTTFGHTLLLICVVMESIGFFFISKIIKIKF